MTGFRFPFQHKNSIPNSAVFILTQVGQGKAQEFGGDSKSRILIALETNGTSNVEEIAQAARVNKGAVERMIPHLIKSGYIQPVGRSEE